MASHITIAPAEGTWVIRAGGAVIGESTRALALAEGTYPPVIYFPRTDLAMDLLERADHTTHCPHKGDATYFTIHSAHGELENAAWSYEAPFDAVAEITGYIAFHPSDEIVIERI